MATDPDNVLILGAGFSKYAGLPLASEFTRELLNVRGLRLDGPSAQQVAYVRAFVDDVFGEGVRRSHGEWPELEEIFTLVDLSANTGHHLGPKYSASDLRVVRRSIIVRMIRMLGLAYSQGRKTADDNRKALDGFFSRFDSARSAVLSVNWDVVFESEIDRTQSIGNIEYGCGAQAVYFDREKVRFRKLAGQSATVLKPHGSVNWLYCDACREVFWVAPQETSTVAESLFRERDWRAVGNSDAKHPRTREPECPACAARSLGTRFATFSYRKALDFPTHAASWRTAETLLKRAVDWVFIGYSMPAADFEFKHLLKRVQLTESIRPKITVITGGGDATRTVERFRKFFGEVKGERTFLENGLDDRAFDHLSRIGVLAGSPPEANVSVKRPRRGGGQ